MPIDYLNGGLPAVAPFVSEMEGSPTENHSAEGFSATVQLKVPFVNRQAVADEIVGNFLEYPRKVGCKAYAQSATSVPFVAESGADGQAITYDWALVTVNYKQFDSVTDGAPTGQFISETLTPNAEFLKIPPDDLVWNNNAGPKLKQSEAPGKLLLGFDYVQTRYNLTSLNTDILTLVSHCNSASVAANLLGLTFGAETLLFYGATPSRTIDYAGNGRWTLSSTFGVRPTGWNKFWRADTQSWQNIYIEGGAIFKPIPTGNFVNLII